VAYVPERLNFGVFMAPLHRRWFENPSLGFEEDLEFIEFLDRIDFDEAWLGEHHSGAVEIFGSPELMIAAAAQRTRRIRLGTGVINLPLHHPFMVAERMVMLDHLTRGRTMLGVGSGALRADFTMIGQDPEAKTRRSAEALEAIMALLRKQEPVDRQTDWFELRDARLQLDSYTKPHLPVVVAGSSSEDRTSAAGRFGLGQLTFARTPDALRLNWEWVEDAAQRYGQSVSRKDWRVMKFVHLAESKQEALDACRARLPGFSGKHLVGVSASDDDRFLPELAAERRAAIIGTPEDAIEHIQYLLDGSGGFGGFMLGMYGLAPPEHVRRSFDLFARYVAPHFQGQYRTMKNNLDWVAATHGGPVGPGPSSAPATRAAD
jgi:limonene 1,2-monooxygenase